MKKRTYRRLNKKTLARESLKAFTEELKRFKRFRISRKYNFALTAKAVN